MFNELPDDIATLDDDEKIENYVAQHEPRLRAMSRRANLTLNQLVDMAVAHKKDSIQNQPDQVRTSEDEFYKQFAEQEEQMTQMELQKKKQIHLQP